MANPLISVIVPCFNQAEFLSETLQSVFDQSWQNWECIIVNDGSPDNTEQVAEGWCAKDIRFKYFKQGNKGVSAARNAGMKIAKGDFIQFLDGDDVIRKDKFTRSLTATENNSYPDLVISNFMMFTEKTDRLSEPYCQLKEEYFNYTDFLLKWDVDFTIPIHCGLFRTSLIAGFLFNENLKGREDWFMWLQAIKRSEQVYFLDEPMALYRINSAGATKKHLLMHENFVMAYRYIYDTLDVESKTIIFHKVMDLYFNEGKKNAQLLEMGLNVKDFIEVEKGKRTLGFFGTFLFRLLRKTGHLMLLKEKNKKV